MILNIIIVGVCARTVCHTQYEASVGFPSSAKFDAWRNNPISLSEIFHVAHHALK
jgi:hypothetical protein